MKKITAIALVIMMLTCFFGCGKKADNELNLVSSGKLMVAISPDFAPMEFVDTNGNFVGFDVMLAEYIAQALGLELELVPMSFEACQTAVAMGSVDMAISGFSWLPEREAAYNLSNFYHAGENEENQVLIKLASNNADYSSAAALSGLKVGAQGASLQESLCKDQLPNCEIVPISDLNTALLQLQNGDFSVLAVAEGNAEAIIANNPQFEKTGFYFEVDEKYTDNLILMKKGNDALTQAVNNVLEQSKQHWDSWYNEALNIAGVDVSYDDDGNIIG